MESCQYCKESLYKYIHIKYRLCENHLVDYFKEKILSSNDMFVNIDVDLINYCSDIIYQIKDEDLIVNILYNVSPGKFKSILLNLNTKIFGKKFWEAIYNNLSVIENDYSIMKYIGLDFQYYEDMESHPYINLTEPLLRYLIEHHQIHDVQHKSYYEFNIDKISNIPLFLMYLDDNTKLADYILSKLYCPPHDTSSFLIILRLMMVNNYEYAFNYFKDYYAGININYNVMTEILLEKYSIDSIINKICVGYRHEYMLYLLDNHEITKKSSYKKLIDCFSVDCNEKKENIIIRIFDICEEKRLLINSSIFHQKLLYRVGATSDIAVDRVLKYINDNNVDLKLSDNNKIIKNFTSRKILNYLTSHCECDFSVLYSKVLSNKTADDNLIEEALSYIIYNDKLKKYRTILKPYNKKIKELQHKRSRVKSARK